MQASHSVSSILLEASLPVQLVMVALVMISIVSWALICKRAKDFRLASNALHEFEERFWSGIDLSKLYVQVNTKTGPDHGEQSIFKAGFKEFNRISQTKGADVESIMQGIQRAMRVALLREREKLESHLPFLATVGSTSPYLGLLGTVWGIMSSFLALANAEQASLNVVAPAIAEALIATAMGLVAAIPAVIAYNRFAAKSDALLNAYDAFSDEFSSILHRQAHLLMGKSGVV